MMSTQAQRLLVWIADHWTWVLLVGLAVAAVIVVFFPGLVEWIKANLAVAIIGGIVGGMGIGVVILYATKGGSER
jgi:hypothetical protein